ncbi:LysR family transcriptional regulator [Bradyrhizobium sp. U87765 SZCCT0131]|uniref:LysR family transcriptional regulator n=1 Tax=unclassified Bradyrhizobium TaxID=2631580 RepID=UPI001BACC415|nr:MULTISPECIES: LysR family transcriptional regulator [unclassified Bradyrhizobium]MBR1223169.1 LysR family transcriptional regulator [Bradyrhizobium sp. U87765 SZCCT0131]MBR1265747.1 LysR family transcriptional regulator [Bradyrhizobium sp. U87765 SZCCT0134]MBR1309282.1 LysR family transcriptional regulator [Bradyrhizobium sp. U87765 SZCCT0110]MBR1323139.1 LysR family transcriptional regulator [Bradyrhizobium sp. U87765 SZCCT0109]MBR1350920.1 LysR family transcriptional regulator [Bradyrhizo
METLANLESFIRSAECGSFSAAARRLGVTPAAVSRNVAMLERNLGIRLFQRSSRSLNLTEDGDRFLASVTDGVETIQSAIADLRTHSGKPAGVLKVSVALTFGLDHVLPFLPAFMERYPDVQMDWSFENRQVDLIGEGFDAAIGGGMELAPGVVAQRLAPLHIVAVASPDYLRGRQLPRQPHELAGFEGISMRSAQTGRMRIWRLRHREGAEAMLEHKARMVANDPEAICRAALMGLGVAMIAMPFVERHLDSGALLRLLPDWYSDLGAISLYFASRKLLPAKTRAFVDHMTAVFREQNLAQRFSAAG